MTVLSTALLRVAKQTGYPNTKSLEFLRNLVLEINPSCVLELGTAYGASAAFMASAIKDGGLVISVDDYRVFEGKTIEVVKDNLKNCGIADKVILVESNTFCLSNLTNVLSAKPEIVFMDASHEYDGLWKEYNSVLPVLPKDHIIVIDDLFLADDLFLSVARFALDLSKQYEFCLTVKNFHQGMAIVFTNYEYLIKINKAIKEVHD